MINIAKNRLIDTTLLVLDSQLTAAMQVALILEEQAQKAITQHGSFSLALSGGSTPVELFKVLASPEWKARIDWAKVDIFWADERCVHPEHEDSNYRLAYSLLLQHVAPHAIYRIESEHTAEVAAQNYEQTLRSYFQLTGGEFPKFDCVLLGLGADGHTASIFPESHAMFEKNKLAVAVQQPPEAKHARITLTLPALNNAGCCIFQANGKGKHKILQQILQFGEPCLPAQMVKLISGKLYWIIDKDAYTGSALLLN